MAGGGALRLHLLPTGHVVTEKVVRSGLPWWAQPRPSLSLASPQWMTYKCLATERCAVFTLWAPPGTPTWKSKKIGTYCGGVDGHFEAMGEGRGAVKWSGDAKLDVLKSWSCHCTRVAEVHASTHKRARSRKARRRNRGCEIWERVEIRQTLAMCA